MIIKSVEISSFGGLKNLRLNFSPKTNLIFGKNGSGKSTVMNFIRLMLYSKTINERSSDVSKSLRKKTKPLDGAPQKGKMIINKNDCDYLIEKTFGKTAAKDELTVTNLYTGENIPIGPEIEAGEFFTGLSLAQFEHCFYMFTSDFANLETELADIKDFSSSDFELKPSYPSEIFAGLNKLKESYISKSGKKGIIIEKEAELNKILSDINESLEYEKTVETLDDEFRAVNNEKTALEKKLKENELYAENSASLKTLNKLYIVKKNIEETEKIFTDLGFDEKKLQEFISLGNILIQNTDARFRIYNETQTADVKIEFDTLYEARKNASEITEKINSLKEKLEALSFAFDKINSLNKKKKLFKTGIIASVILSIGLALSVYFAFNFQNFAYIAALILIADIFSLFKTLALKKHIKALKRDDNNINLSAAEIKKLLLDSDSLIKSLTNELEEIYNKNGVNNFDGLSEKYYAKKAEYEHSDSENLKNSAIESSKKFIKHICTFAPVSTFEDAKEKFEAIKKYTQKSSELKNEYENLLEFTGSGDKSLDEINNEIERINRFLSDNDFLSETEKVNVKNRISKLTEKLMQISGEYPKEFKSVYELNHLKKQCEDELGELKDNYSSLLLAEKVLNESYNEMNFDFVPAITKNASQILAKLENNPNAKLLISDNISLKTKRDIADEFISSGYLSESERNKVYLALRFAIIDTIEKNDLFPVIADDIFASYDYFSKEKAIEFLKEFSKERQVIFFTCHEDDRNIFEKTYTDVNILNI